MNIENILQRMDIENALQRIEQRLQRIDHKLALIIWKEEEMSAEMDTLTAAVRRNSDVEDSAVLLIQGIAKQLADAIAAGNPAALTALSAELNAKADSLAAAVSANTPAA